MDARIKSAHDEPKVVGLMPIRLDTSAADFAVRFKAFLATKRELS